MRVAPAYRPPDRLPSVLDLAFPPFRPPAWLRSPHAQTVWASRLRRLPPDAPRRERLELPDGDFVDLDWTEPGPAGPRRVAVVAHGLEGSSSRTYVRGMAQALATAGWAVCAWNLRGCSGEPNRLLRAYHSGATEDLEAVLEHSLAQGYEAAALVGFSLGGNLTLKHLGDAGAAVDPRVVGAVGVSVPVDLAASAAVMERPSRQPYMLYFLRSLERKLAEKGTRYPDAPAAAGVRRMRSFRAFDGHFTAPVHGFASADDYWARAASGPVLAQIRVPTLLLNALDDPFLAPSCFPADVGPWVRVLTPARGGHVGFVQAARATTYAEDTAVAWLEQAARLRDVELDKAP